MALSELDIAIQIARKECNDPYALIYLKAIPEAIEDSGEKGFYSALLYAYQMMNKWKGKIARDCKKIIKSYLKKNQSKGD